MNTKHGISSRSMVGAREAGLGGVGPCGCPATMTPKYGIACRSMVGARDAGLGGVGPCGSYTGRFFETRWSPEAVILSAAKDLRLARREILRCAQDDTSPLAGSFPKKPTRVSPCGCPGGGKGAS